MLRRVARLKTLECDHREIESKSLAEAHTLMVRSRNDVRSLEKPVRHTASLRRRSWRSSFAVPKPHLVLEVRSLWSTEESRRGKSTNSLCNFGRKSGSVGVACIDLWQSPRVDAPEIVEADALTGVCFCELRSDGHGGHRPSRASIRSGN